MGVHLKISAQDLNKFWLIDEVQNNNSSIINKIIRGQFGNSAEDLNRFWQI